MKTNKSEGNTLCLDELGRAWSNYHVFHTYSDVRSQIQEKIFHMLCSIVRLRISIWEKCMIFMYIKIPHTSFPVCILGLSITV